MGAAPSVAAPPDPAEEGLVLYDSLVASQLTVPVSVSEIAVKELLFDVSFLSSLPSSSPSSPPSRYVNSSELQAFLQPGFTLDPDFSRSDSLQGHRSFSSRAIRWRSLHDLPLFPTALSHDSVVQGQTGDCFLVAALSLLSSSPGLLSSLIQPSSTSSNLCTVTTYSMGSPLLTTVDSLLPVSTLTNLPVFASSRPPSPCSCYSLVEKAFAKIAGGRFSNLDGGNVAEILMDLLNIATDDVHLDDASENITADGLKTRVKAELAKGNLLAAGNIDVANSGDEARGALNLRKNHA